MKLSSTYREDADMGVPSDVKEYLDRHFLYSLKNRTVLNPRLLVVFSGGNGVGKSVLSRKIESELSGVVLENDEVKTHLLKYDPQIDRDNLQRLTWQYTMDLYRRIDKEVPNGLIVRDGVIDWYHDRILPIFEAQGYDLFVIGYDISEQKSAELIRARGDKPTVSVERLISLFNEHAMHQVRFREVHKPNIMLNDDTIFDHDSVIKMIRERLESLRAATKSMS
jgi:hypothetical protein